tara:strand:- start:213 stop:1169 length:957 start_codon:yes stop_codon:yes gene_type:complete
LNSFALYAPYSLKPKQHSEGRLQITSPNELCIYFTNKSFPSSAKRTINFINALSDITLKQGGKVHIDFSSLHSLTASASVLLFAEITRIQLVTDIVDVITFTWPMDEDFTKLLKTSGLYKAIIPGTHRKIVKLFDDDHPYQSGIDPNKFLISTLLSLHKNGLELSKPEAKVISKGIQEAMLNVIHHAYLDFEDQQAGIGSRWWQLSHCDTVKKVVTFIIYDKGASIPATISDLLNTPCTDADAIEYAFTKGITRLLGTTRGKGSQDIKDAAKVKDSSTLLVMSGKGVYLLDNNNGSKIKSELPHAINGTMIEWSIPYE